ncbi:MAG: hypothetical protein BWY76_00938 [bacterium ADurb.Bin429]|nr:MAG: hypothetical protein BWY76_00938 [bacterium ADurb.Bin429]
MMRMHVPLPKAQPWMLPVTIVCLALGMLVAFMLKVSAPKKLDTTNMTRDQLIALYAKEMSDHEQLLAEYEKLREKYDRMVDSATTDQKLRAELQKVIDDLRVRAGSTAVTGPGIVVIIDDTKLALQNPPDINVNPLLTHDVDLLQVVNELRAAGAEAISINDQRVAGSSAIRCVGPAINVNNKAVSAPFVVRAIGKPDVLYGAINMPFGILDQLRQMNTQVEVSKREKLTIPAVAVLPSIEVGTPELTAPAPPKGGE